jgi:hypothetical protein
MATTPIKNAGNAFASLPVDSGKNRDSGIQTPLSIFTVFFRIVTKGGGSLLIVAPITPSWLLCRGIGGCIGLAKSTDPRHGGAALLK